MGFQEVNQRYVDSAYREWRYGNKSEALSILEDGLRETGNDGYIALNYGWVLYDLGRMSEAKVSFEIAYSNLSLQHYKEMAAKMLKKTDKEIRHEAEVGHIKLSEIKVQKLFGCFDHQISLEPESGLTILLAPNGYGKTTILKMIFNLFNCKFRQLADTNFEQMILYFDNRTKIALNRIPISGGDAVYAFQDKKYGIEIIYHTPNGLSQRFLYPEGENNVPKWLSDIVGSISISFLNTNRLWIVEKDGFFQAHDLGESPVLAIEKHSEELGKMLTGAVNKILNATSENFNKAIEDYIEKCSVPFDDIYSEQYNDFRHELIKIVSEAKILHERLHNVGIINYKFPMHIELLLNTYVHKDNILHTLAGSFLEAYKGASTLLDKVELFCELVNERLFKKKLRVQACRGIQVENLLTGEKVPLHGLSSGEQHLIVSYYQMLFKVEPGSILIIDEPEISLHAGWQRYFIRDVMRIREIQKYYVLVATHSPSIIDRYWDNAIELVMVSDNE